MTYEAAVQEGKQIIAAIDTSKDRMMRLGELADGVHKSYGERKLQEFAKAICIAACTLARCRSVYRAWTKNGRPAPALNYSVAQELQAHPKRWEIIEETPNITKRDARKKMRELRRAQAGSANLRREEVKNRLKAALKLANAAVRLAENTVQPNDEAVLREVIEPNLLPSIRDGADALLKLVDYLEDLASA